MRPASIRDGNIRYLGVSKFILSVVNVDGRQELFTGLLAVNELSLWDGTGIQHSVSVTQDMGIVIDGWQKHKPGSPSLSSHEREDPKG